MILSDKDIRQLLKSGDLEVDPIEKDQIGPTSIDLRLNDTIIIYCCSIIDLGKTNPDCEEFTINIYNGYTLEPGAFVLACTLERIHISNGYQGFIETKGDIARAGLQVHNTDGHVDPGSNHVITLEIKNNNTIPVILYPNIYICQLFIHKLSTTCEKPYNGKYFGHKKPTAYIP